MTGDVSVVIATRGDRPDALDRCLCALDSGSVRPREVIVVFQGGGKPVIACGMPQIDVIRGEKPGLSRGRNAGIARAACEFVAVTDDDCVPSGAWLEVALAALRADPRLAAVFGAVEPLPDASGELVAVSSRRSTKARDTRVSFAPWRLGSGGNTVVRRSWLSRIGGYDERLGAGSPGRAGEDVDLIHRLLRAGAWVRYEPGALVLHEQKRTDEHRERRYGYGVGVGAACGLWVRSGDLSAGLVLVAWVLLRLRLLTGSCARGRWPAAVDELHVLRGTFSGVCYGLRTQ